MIHSRSRVNVMYGKRRRSRCSCHDAGIRAITKLPAYAFNRAGWYGCYSCIEISFETIVRLRDLKNVVWTTGGQNDDWLTVVGLTTSIVKNLYANLVCTGLRIGMIDNKIAIIILAVVNASISTIAEGPANPRRLFIIAMPWQCT